MAFRQLFDTQRRKVFTYLLKITKSREFSEDAVQEIFLKIWSTRTTLPGIDNINAYLHRMAHNYAYSGFKRLARETLVLAAIKEQQPTFNDIHPGRQLIAKEVQAAIQKIVDQLTPSQRKVFLLSREQGLKQEDIAKELGISIMAVKKHMVDALRFLREETRNQFGSDAIGIFVVFQLGVLLAEQAMLAQV